MRVDDATALADAIERFLRDAELRTQFAAAARRLVVENFSSEIIGRQTVALYRHLVEVPNPKAVPERAANDEFHHVQ